MEESTGQITMLQFFLRLAIAREQNEGSEDQPVKPGRGWNFAPSEPQAELPPESELWVRTPERR